MNLTTSLIIAVLIAAALFAVQKFTSLRIPPVLFWAVPAAIVLFPLLFGARGILNPNRSDDQIVAGRNACGCNNDVITQQRRFLARPVQSVMPCSLALAHPRKNGFRIVGCA